MDILRSPNEESHLLKPHIFLFFSISSTTDKCLLTDNIYDYYNVSQGKVTIPSMDDGEEFSLTDVSWLNIVLDGGGGGG